MHGKSLICLAVLLAACGHDSPDPTPPRVDSAPVIPPLASTLVVPVRGMSVRPVCLPEALHSVSPWRTT